MRSARRAVARPALPSPSGRTRGVGPISSRHQRGRQGVSRALGTEYLLPRVQGVRDQIEEQYEDKAAVQLGPLFACGLGAHRGARFG